MTRRQNRDAGQETQARIYITHRSLCGEVLRLRGNRRRFPCEFHERLRALFRLGPAKIHPPRPHARYPKPPSPSLDLLRPPPTLALVLASKPTLRLSLGPGCAVHYAALISAS